MCGIIGTTNAKISLDLFKEAHKTIYQRGPDSQLYITDYCFVFGHSRLAIIDLDERSNQPFVFQHENKKITVVFNGEIYNFLILKEILEKKGYVFKTSSDTEVLCASYLEWGISCFDYFEGMWALGLFDHQLQQLVITKDRVGKKPLYYSFEDGVVSFSSSIWGVSKLCKKKDICIEGLQLYFALGFVPDHFSIIKGINSMLPGKIIVFQKDGNQFYVKEENNSVFKSFSAKESSVSNLMKEAIVKRVIADVPIATLMSGGVDSTIVTKITRKFYKEVKTFFVDFEDKRLSEFYWADYLSKRNNLPINRVMLRNVDLNDSFADYAEVYEEPFADYSGIPSIAIFKKVSEEFKVVLTGDGGDELFYGYPHYSKKLMLYVLMKLNNVFKISRFFNVKVKKILDEGIEKFESNYLKNHAILSKFAADYIDQRFNQVRLKEKSFLRTVIQYDRVFNNLPYKYLVKTDRASMFSGTEVRSPFLDEALLRHVRKLPTWMIFTPCISKLYLKILYFKCFGIKYFLSKKKGFTPPIKELRERYFKEDDFNQLKDYFKELNSSFFNDIKNLVYDDLLNDNILFDRFFFFNIWRLKSYSKNQ
ncbi:asparagine synthase (glutamine-hydrolyzing) [Flavobacterium terrae]|uniref:asparagine synthase (glutamine-hydrolyzing) n=1 Tax=Flavobacterium terrae TaxID=415425 RepID=A0A1M6FSU4_9FLAO|nr:asparagine synthase (glutamine-hydrolyzing) [Flavobacterium terrae]SHJ00798.1 asparagine synthase (glutamine-hydrolysing) [Flavobacterium terrae]